MKVLSYCWPFFAKKSDLRKSFQCFDFDETTRNKKRLKIKKRLDQIDLKNKKRLYKKGQIKTSPLFTTFLITRIACIKPIYMYSRSQIWKGLSSSRSGDIFFNLYYNEVLNFGVFRYFISRYKCCGLNETNFIDFRQKLKLTIL